MVNAIRGTLISCDSAIIEFIKKTTKENRDFGIIELDEEHLLIYTEKTDIVEYIQKKLDELLDENTFEFNGEGTREAQFRIVY
jgi:hypothetical protein